MDEAMRQSLSGFMSRLSWKLFLPTLVLLLACAGGTLLALERSSVADWLHVSRLQAASPAEVQARAEAAERSAQAGLDILLAAE
jgi:hypothetical protein